MSSGGTWYVCFRKAINGFDTGLEPCRVVVVKFHESGASLSVRWQRIPCRCPPKRQLHGSGSFSKTNPSRRDPHSPEYCMVSPLTEKTEVQTRKKFPRNRWFRQQTQEIRTPPQAYPNRGAGRSSLARWFDGGWFRSFGESACQRSGWGRGGSNNDAKYLGQHIFLGQHISPIPKKRGTEASCRCVRVP